MRCDAIAQASSSSNGDSSSTSSLAELGRLGLGQDEPAHPEALLHLVERLLAEVAHPEQVLVLELEELPDLDDVVALERVVGPHREVELLDRHVEHVRRERRDAGHAAVGGHLGLADRHERAELLDEDRGGAAERLLGPDRAVGLDLDRQLVEVRDLADARALDPVVDLPDRGEDRVDGDDADRQRLGALDAEVADAALDRHVHVDRHVVRVEGHEHEVAVHDLDVRRLHDVRGEDRAGAALGQPELDRVRREALHAELLGVQDDLGDVFLDARDRGELLVHVADLERRHGRALERGQEDAPERVAERHAVAGLKGPDLVLGVRADLFDGLDLRGVELFDHEWGYLE